MHAAASYMPMKTQHANPYFQQEVMNLSPVQIISRMYDISIVSIKRNDVRMARRVLNDLILALNFDYKEMSTGLYRLYDYCKRCLDQKQYSEAIFVLEELRGAWNQAFNL